MAQSTTNTNAWFNPNRPGALKLVTDEALNDSDKTIIVPAGEIWQLLSVYAELIATGDAGNRQVELHVRDDSQDVIGIFPAAAVQIASATEYYNWGVAGDLLETVATYHYLPLAPTVLPPSYEMRIFDSAAIQAAADDLTIQILVLAYETD